MHEFVFLILFLFKYTIEHKSPTYVRKQVSRQLVSFLTQFNFKLKENYHLYTFNLLGYQTYYNTFTVCQKSVLS